MVVVARPHVSKVTVITGENRSEGMATGSGEEEQPEEKVTKERRVRGGGLVGAGSGPSRRLSSLVVVVVGDGWWSAASSFALSAGTLARRFLLLVLTHGVSVAHDHLVHPGERLREEHRPLKEAQVAAVQRQGKDGVGLFR